MDDPTFLFIGFIFIAIGILGLLKEFQKIEPDED